MGATKKAALRFTSRQVAGLGGLASFEGRMSAINARTAKQIGDTIATGKDDVFRGASVNMAAANAAGALHDESGRALENGNGLKRITESGKTQYKSLGGQWVDETDVVEGHKRFGKDVAAQQAILSYEQRKAMTDEEVQGITDRYVPLAQQQWGMTENQAQGAWIGAGFENQNQHLEYKNTKSNGKEGTAKLDVAKFAKEAYEKKGSYQLSQMSGHTVVQLENAFKTAVETGDTESQDRLKAVAETFMHQLSSGGGGHRTDEGAVDDPAAIARAEQAMRDAAAGSQRGQTSSGAATGGAPRMVSSSGSGAVGEAVYRFARTTGVIAAPPMNPERAGSPQTNTGTNMDDPNYTPPTPPGRHRGP